MINRYIPYMRLINHKIAKAMNRTCYFESKYGVKAYNKPLFHPQDINCEKIVELYPEQLYLGFDGLRDEYTLLDTNITKSPHYDMIMRLRNHLSISDCDYVIREGQGALDGRFEIIVDAQKIKFHQSRYEESLKMINTDSYNPVLFYNLNGRCYLMDGKHRAALSVILDKKLKGVMISNAAIQNYTYIHDLYEQMVKKHGNYSKNIKHIIELLSRN